MPPSSLLLFLLLLHAIPAAEILTQLSTVHIHDLSCVVGLCAVAEGCEGNPFWRRVLEWPQWKEKPTDCQHAFMIRRNVNPGDKEKSEDESKENMKKEMNKRGEEYFIVMASGGPDGPAREMRLETSMLKPLFGVTHDTLNKFDNKNSRKRRWTIDSYDYQTVTASRFEAGVLVRITGERGNALSAKWEDFCVFIHSSRSMQHLCGGLERLFQRIPSKQFPMKLSDCQDDLSDESITVDEDTGFFKCRENEDDVIKTSDKTMEYLRLHYAYCLAGKTIYLVEHHDKGFYAMQYTSVQKVKCGDPAKKRNERCKVPEVPDNVTEYCGVRCERAGRTPNPDGGGEADVLRCDFLNAVIDDKVYRKGDEVPVVECDPTGWWRYSQSAKEGALAGQWITSMYCFYPQSDVYSDCVLDRFKCGKYGQCPKHRSHQVDCDGNDEGLVLAVFHQGLENGFTTANKLGCDAKNGWWTVNGKSLPKTAYVDCVWPLELEIMRRAAKEEEWEPKTFEARALSEIGPSVRIASLIVAVFAFAAMIAVIIIAKVRLHGPKTRMVTRHLRALYPSLLNEEERLDAAKAEREYQSVDCEAAGLALHQIHKLLQEQEGENKEKEKELQLHTHWISLSWPKQNLLLERALLHRAFFCLKVLYDKFTLPAEQPFEEARPGLREKILKVSMEYKAFIENWTPNEFLFSLAFATLTKAELDAFRRNAVTRKNLRSKPQKEMSVINMVMNEAAGADASKNAETAEVAAVAPVAEAVAAAVATPGGGEKVEEVTAPPAQKE